MKSILLAVFFLLLLCSGSKANNADTIHVSHYNISVDTINYTTHTIRAATELTIHPKVNGMNAIKLDLLKLIPDSIISQSSALGFTYNDTILQVSLPATLNIGDSIVMKVYYHGAPITEPGGWGGFYWSGTYAYNIGVALNSQPHNYAKTWFPCVDEFTDRATYEFHVTTPSTYKAFCNGILQDSTVNGNGTLTWNWQFNQTIPTYEAGIAVAPFYTLRRTYQGIPVQIAIMPADSNKTIAYFAKLDTVLARYIQSYGPYPFDKVGYSITPFGGGGMEHATCIVIGSSLVTTTLIYEYIWAHELSHMWFGDKVTCDKAEEMWLNEGWACYNENVYKSYTQGEAVYDSLMHALHKKVVQYAHIPDNGYYALNNVPQAYTYSTYNVYYKGAVAASKIRRFMGDSLFFIGIKAYLNNRAWTAVNSDDLRSELQNATGINMTGYFNTQIATPGFPHVSVDSFTVAPNGSNYDVTVYTKERQKGNSQTFTLPVDLTFSDAGIDTTVQVTVNAPANSFTVTLPFIPQWISADRYGKLLSAQIAYERTITNNGTYTYPDVNSSVQVIDSGSGSSLIRIEHNYVKPDDFISNPGGVRISDYRYYKVDGNFSTGLLAKGTFNYDGNTGASNGYLDNTLLTGAATEDSLLIFYRPGPGYNWQLVNGYSINFQVSHTDKRGLITVDTLKRGEYVLGVRDYTVNIPGLAYVGNNLKIAPNPSDRIVHIAFLLNGYKGVIEISDARGRKVWSTDVFSHQEMIDWDSYKVGPGVYLIRLIDNGEVTGTRKVIIRRK